MRRHSARNRAPGERTPLITTTSSSPQPQVPTLRPQCLSDNLSTTFHRCARPSSRRWGMSDQPAVPAGGGGWAQLVLNSTAVPRALGKLIETVGDQIGLFLKPVHTRRQAQADADAVVAHARAKCAIKVLNAENKYLIQEIEDRAEERVREREARRQQNIENISANAARELPESVTSEPVDQDWVAQFFNHCQDVSNEQMQALWGRLLAGEVTKPGSYSLRTLALVRVLSKADADLFTRFCTYTWWQSSDLVPLLPPGGASPDIVPDLSFTDFMQLEAIGLVRYQPLSGFVLKFHATAPVALSYHRRAYLFIPLRRCQPVRFRKSPLGHAS